MDGQHWIKDPVKAIAFFTTDGNLYGLSNGTNTQLTVETFYDIMSQQHAYFNTNPFSDRFFREHGFILENNGWRLEVTDNLGLRNDLEYRPQTGWYYNNMLLKHQPYHVGDLMHLFMEKTGAILKRIS